MIILLGVVVVAVGAPAAAVLMFSLAVRREEVAHSLSGRPAGPLQAAARRLVGFHGSPGARRPARRKGSRARRRHPDRGGYLTNSQLPGGEFPGGQFLDGQFLDGQLLDGQLPDSAFLDRLGLDGPGRPGTGAGDVGPLLDDPASRPHVAA